MTPSQPGDGSAGQARLSACVRDIERHVGKSGWDQPPRLYALAVTSELIAAEPNLAQALVADGDQPELTPIEQDQFPEGPLDQVLAGIAWPSAVVGCAIAVERLVLPPEAEAELPESADEELRAAQSHPRRQDVRIVVGVDRQDHRVCAIRVRGYDADSQLVLDPSGAPGLVEALRQTLRD